MNHLLGRVRVRVAGVALLAFAAVLMAGPAPSAAASYTLAFNGTVTGTVTDPGGSPGGVFQALGLVAGDAVSGTVTLDPFNQTTSVVTPKTFYFHQPATTFTFHISHPGKLDLDYSNSAPGFVASTGAPSVDSALGFSLGDSISTLLLEFRTDATGGPLSSLA